MRITLAAAAAVLAACTLAAPASAATGYYTYHFDNGRTGWNPNEKTLTAAAVGSRRFHLVRYLRADSVVYAQPLYAPGIAVAGAKHDLALVATENDSVYAYDANDGALVWRRSFIDPAAGVSAVSTSSVGGCGQITPTIGISSTPVIDPSTATLYLIAKIQITKGGTTTYHHQLHALDLADGKDRVAPAEVRATVVLADGSRQSFNPQWQQNRPGLVLANGTVYAGFGSSCDSDANAVHGWIFAFNCTTLHTVAVLNTATSSAGSYLGAVWQSTYGLAADTAGNLYFATGNGSFDADSGGGDYGESVLRVNPRLTVTDYFSPGDEGTLSNADQDIGSVGVMLLPNLPNSSAHLAVSGVKSGTMYLLDRDDMGRFNASADRALQEIALEKADDSLYGGPAYYNGYVYWGASDQPMEAFALTLAPKPKLTLRSRSANVYPGGGEIPAVSSDGTVAGSAVVWATTRPGQVRRERGHAASCCAPRARPGALVGGDSARRRITRAALTSASST